MLSVPIYYIVYGGILISLAIGLCKVWDRQQSRKVLPIIDDPSWLGSCIESAEEPTQRTPQELYDFSLRYIACLKGVLADPTPKKLNKLAVLISSDENLYEQLWSDIQVRVSYVFESYKFEFCALIDSVSKHSSNPTSLYAAYRLCKCVPEPTTKLRELMNKIGNKRQVRQVFSRTKRLA